tara:strand:- start:178 stop:1599 length:1422 start_codon:yes stop_codon:yes gene_type:complete
MKCKSCGFEIKQNKKFCTNCGWKIEINLEESENQINNEKAKDKIKTINNQKYSSAKGNKTKNNFLIPLGGILGFSLIAIIAGISSYDEGDNYVKSSLWLNDYLKSDGDCCNDNFYAIDRNKSKLLVLNSILEINANDSEALRQKKIIDNDLFLEKNKKNKNVKIFGDYSVKLGSLRIDRDHFFNFGAITYQANVLKNGTPFDKPYSFSCSSKEKYDWDKEVWEKTKTFDEESLLKSMCNSKKNDPAIIPLLKVNSWKNYSNNYWINTNNWEEDKSTNYKDFDTNFYSVNDQETSLISVNCTDNQVALFKKGDWTKYKNAKGVFKKILNDKCDPLSLFENSNTNNMPTSSRNREWERDDGSTVIFNPTYLASIGWGEENRIYRSLKYFYWLKENPSKQYASFIRCNGYKGIFEEDGGRYNPHKSRGWVRFKLEKTSAQKEGLLIANEFCPKRSWKSQQVFVDQAFNDWDEKVLR